MLLTLLTYPTYPTLQTSPCPPYLPRPPCPPLPTCPARPTCPTRLRIGDRVTVVPNHACVVANLTTLYLVADGDTVLDTCKVDARGLVN